VNGVLERRKFTSVYIDSLSFKIGVGI